MDSGILVTETIKTGGVAQFVPAAGPLTMVKAMKKAMKAAAAAPKAMKAMKAMKRRKAMKA